MILTAQSQKLQTMPEAIGAGSFAIGAANRDESSNNLIKDSEP